jgi:hypothetical protein
MSESQLVRREDIADAAREGLSIGESWYNLGPRDLEGGRSISEDSAIADEPYGLLLFWDELLFEGFDGGSRFLESPGVPGAVESDPMVSNKSPPLPELTVMCIGRVGCNDLSGAISNVQKESELLSRIRRSHLRCGSWTAR